MKGESWAAIFDKGGVGGVGRGTGALVLCTMLLFFLRVNKRPKDFAASENVGNDEGTDVGILVDEGAEVGTTVGARDAVGI